jgi:hypothetical protein
MSEDLQILELYETEKTNYVLCVISLYNKEFHAEIRKPLFVLRKMFSIKSPVLYLKWYKKYSFLLLALPAGKIATQYSVFSLHPSWRVNTLMLGPCPCGVSILYKRFPSICIQTKPLVWSSPSKIHKAYLPLHRFAHPLVSIYFRKLKHMAVE